MPVAPNSNIIFDLIRSDYDGTSKNFNNERVIRVPIRTFIFGNLVTSLAQNASDRSSTSERGRAYTHKILTQNDALIDNDLAQGLYALVTFKLDRDTKVFLPATSPEIYKIMFVDRFEEGRITTLGVTRDRAVIETP